MNPFVKVYERGGHFGSVMKCANGQGRYIEVCFEDKDMFMRQILEVREQTEDCVQQAFDQLDEDFVFACRDIAMRYQDIPLPGMFDHVNAAKAFAELLHTKDSLANPHKHHPDCPNHEPDPS